MIRRLLGSCAALLACTLLAPAGARAHGGMWRANRISIAPDDPARIVLQSDLRGPIFSSDGGESWRWICAEAYGRSSIGAAPVSMLLVPGGRTLVASYGRGLQASEGEPCSFAPPAGFTATSVRDVIAAGDTILALGSEELDGSVCDVLFASPDHGRSFTRLGAPLPTDFTATGVRAEAAVGGRVYVAGLRDRGWVVARSDDRGASWTFGEPVRFESRVGWSASMPELDPARPDVVFVLQDEVEWDLEQPSGDRLYVSDDGGLRFRSLYADGRPLRGFARAPDGATLLLGGERGLFRAPLADALARGQSAFTQLAAIPFYGLTWTSTGLYAGREEFALTSLDAYSLGFSRDGGESFEHRMSLCQTEPLACPPDTSVGELCPAVFSDGWSTGGGFKEDFLESERCLPKE